MAWWSLAVEAQFYLLMPLLALVFKIQSPLLRRSLLAASALTSFTWQHARTWIITSTILYSIQYFLIGLLLADLFESAPHNRTQRAWLDVTGLLALGALFLLPSWWRVAAPALLFVVLYSALRGKTFRRALSSPWVAAIGGMCYTIYLWHLFVMAFVLKVTGRLLLQSNFPLSFAIQALLILPTIFVFSVVLFVLVEKPCMETDWPAPILGRFRPAPVATSE
jgi:peptidoglycan/LPS O-acetylase OafA/YrhL